MCSFPQMFMSEAGKISQKIKVWFSDYFNVSDFVAIVTFFIGFGLRLGGGEAFIPGRTVYCLNIIFWYVRLMDILAVNQQAGPYVMMIAKMVSETMLCDGEKVDCLFCLFYHPLFSTCKQESMYEILIVTKPQEAIANGGLHFLPLG